MFRILWIIFLFLTSAAAVCFASDSPQLFQNPTINQDTIVFSYGGDLWSAPRSGGEARRLTSSPGVESNPVFSPDGAVIAFTGQYDGNTDVFTVPVGGGMPRRLTYHPGADIVEGWTTDGKSVLFRSSRASFSRFYQLWTVSTAGDFPQALPIFQAHNGAYSPDGKRLAYMPLSPAFTSWKRYRGGRTTYIQIVALANSHVETKIPRRNSNDFNPMWIGEHIYFLSDRNGPVTLFSFSPASGAVEQLIENKEFDLKSASAGPGAIVYEQFGGLAIYDLETGKTERPVITLAGDFPEVRPHWVEAANSIRDAAISPTGVRAVFAARGEILTVPAEKGDIRNLTKTPAVHERSPSWSPDGKNVAFFSDESGEYALHICGQLGQKDARKISLGDPPSFFYDPSWSPDSKKILYTDKRLNIWYLDLDQDNPAPVNVDTDLIYNRRNRQTPIWSPDAKWIAYSRLLKNRLAAIFVYSLESGKTHQLTDGMSDAQFPVFDQNGKYLYFAASTNIGPALGEGLSRLDHSVSRNIYFAVLDKSLPSPLAPESDEEKIDAPDPGQKTDSDESRSEKEAGDKKADAKDARTTKDKKAKNEEEAKGVKKKDSKPDGKKTPQTIIDFDGITTRILTLPVPGRNYVGLHSGKDGVLFMAERTRFNPYNPGPTSLKIHRFDLKKREEKKVTEGVNFFTVSTDGKKILVRRQRQWSILPAMTPAKPGKGALKLTNMKVWVDPPAEWRQIYHEIWRGERDFFYSPQFHGLDLAKAEKRYQPFLDSVVSRADLNYLFREMLGELTVSHLFVGGGDLPDVERVPGGLLGTDYVVENGRYRFGRIYDGENWNPQLKAPLTQPGVNVKEGEYLLAVNGMDLKPSQNVHYLLEATAGKSVILRVGPDPDGKDARDVTVVPVRNEYGLRNLAWIEDNRLKVDELSDGRIAYVYLPNTHITGFTFFNRYFFSQLDKQAILIDERYNGGGNLADYVVDYLRRPLLNYITGREGTCDVMPYGAVFGPKAMLINENAGSGGDALPYYFRKMRIGPLLGKRTWGGLVRAGGMPVLMDGGYATAPDAALWSESGEWVGENKGIAPDVEVDQDPAAVRAGHDPQMEKGIEHLLNELKKNPPRKYKHPPYSDYHQDRHWPKN